MVATEPDVGLLTSSAQIFASNHTLPQIRQIHKALNVQVDDKAARLRTQVGSSYRELLGTADTIVQMRTDIEAAQATLAGMGARCGRAVVGAKVAALATFVDHDQEHSVLSLAARARLLDACARTVARLLSRTNPDGSVGPAPKQSKAHSRAPRRHSHEQLPSWGERLVLAAKVLVLSRLLVSSIDDKTAAAGASRAKAMPRPAGRLQEHAVLASIETSKRSLVSLRRRLRDIVEIVERSVLVTASTIETADDETGDDDGSGSDDERGLHGRKSGASASATGAGRDDLLRAMCAYSLATTSGTRDALWQLLHVRSQAMALAFEMDDEGHEQYQQQQQQQQNQDNHALWKAENVLRGLALYTKTLLDVQTLLPHRLPEALLGLKKRALLDDDALRQMETLRLDTYSRWCGEDVQYFKPYIRHDDLDAAQAREMLGKWAERGGEVLLDGLRRALDQRPAPVAQQQQQQQQQQQPVGARRSLDLHAIVDLRTSVLQLWIRDSSKVRSLDPSDLLDQLRAAFHEQMLQVLGAKVAKLRLVGSEVAAVLASWQTGVASRRACLWGTGGGGSGGGLDTDLPEGAVPFVRAVTARLHGCNDAVAKAVASYMTWRHVINDVAATIDQLRRQRWDNDADDVVEDEETIAERQQLLSRQDPQALHDRLEASLATAFADLDAQIAGEWNTTAADARLSAATKGGIAMYLVRVLREIQSRPVTTAVSADPLTAAGATAKTPTMSSFPPMPLSSSSSSSLSTAGGKLGRGIVPSLHEAIVHVVAEPALAHFSSSVLTRRTVAGRVLWEGEGPAALPSTPSPGVFKFLRDLSRSMGDAGMDLWSAAAVGALKRQVSGAIAEQWNRLLETAEFLEERKTGGQGGKDEKGGKNDKNEKDENEKSNGEEPPEADAASTTLSEEKRRDLFVQWLFDIAWLRCSLRMPQEQADGRQDETCASQRLAELEEAVYARTGLASDSGSNGGADKTPQQRVAKAAEEYWKKTSLLFGLLV